MDEQLEISAEVVDPVKQETIVDAAMVEAVPIVDAAMVEAVRHYYAVERVRLELSIKAIENFLGFLDVEGDLSARVGKLERFTGVGG